MPDDLIPQLTLGRNKGLATIKVTFGGAQEVGSYQVLLQDGNTWLVVGKGNNMQPPIEHPIGDANGLDGRLLSWDLEMTVLQTPGEYDATVEIFQAHTTIGTRTYHGKVPRADEDPDSSDNPVKIMDMRRVVSQ